MAGFEQWLSAHSALVWWVGATSAVTCIASLVLVPILLARMHADHFCAGSPLPVANGGHPALRLLGRVGKNLLGGVLVAVGIAMLALPGQGIVTVLVGLALLNFPGKRRLERRLASQRRVRSSIDWIRERAGQSPLVFDDDQAESTGGRDIH